MGFSDRDYLRDVPYDDDGYRRRRGRGWSITTWIVAINVALFLINGLFFPGNGLTNTLRMVPAALTDPLEWWRTLTYGFVHSPFGIGHILGNMICLIMFGYGLMLGIGPGGAGLFRGENVEERLGRIEYLCFYLLTIIVGGIVYGIVNFGDPSGCYGASGGCAGVVVLYALLFPNKTLLFMMVIPMPMWMIGAIIVGMDAYGAAGGGDQGIGYSVHLAGAAFALFYYFVFLKNRRRMTDVFSTLKWKRKPKLKIYDNDPTPKTSQKSEKDVEFDKRLDEILDRYGKVGESGLTPEEREFLKKASKKYKNR